MKGIVLAGGHGTRLYPATQAVNKQLLPVYDKPMVYYSIATLMMANIRDILIISTPCDLPDFVKLLGSGDQWGLNFYYLPQPEPKGIGQAFVLGEKFIGHDDVGLILGDNIFYGHRFPDYVRQLAMSCASARMFSYRVHDPERYGVVEFDKDGHPIGIEEKPAHPKSNYAIPGLYFYDDSVIQVAKDTSPSARGEIEITDINRWYMSIKEGFPIYIQDLGRGTAWLDTGTPSSLLKASIFIETIEERQGLKVCCPEEIALSKGFITKENFLKLADKWRNTDYGKYLLQIADS